MTNQEVHIEAAVTMKKLITKYRKKKNPKWDGGKFSAILRVEKGLRGEVGEDFVVEMLKFAGYADAKKEGKRSSPNAGEGAFDIKANRMRIEVKTATMDVHDNFQFGGIKYNGKTPYDLLFVIGIAPDDVFFRIYRKGEIPPGLPSMAKNTPGTHKLTLKKQELLATGCFVEEAVKYLDRSSA